MAHTSSGNRTRKPEELRAVADRLKTSQTRALQLAVTVMSRLTERIEEGATIVVRDKSGKETVMWLPELETGSEREGNSVRATKSGS